MAKMITVKAFFGFSSLVLTLTCIGIYLQPDFTPGTIATSNYSASVVNILEVKNDGNMYINSNFCDDSLLLTEMNYKWDRYRLQFVTLGELLRRPTCVFCDEVCEVVPIKKVSNSFRAAEDDPRRIEILTRLGSIIQSRIEQLQNPKDCSAVKKIDCSCSMRGRGFAAQVHQVTFCLLLGYITNRTMVLNVRQNKYGNWDKILEPISSCYSKGCQKSDLRINFHIEEIFNSDDEVIIIPRHGRWRNPTNDFPIAIPEDIAFTLTLLESEPPAWWTGQFTKYCMRIRPEIEKEMAAELREVEAGIHVRRTDKLRREGSFRSIDEYMGHVENFYNNMVHKASPQYVFVATEASSVIRELGNYTSYNFIYNKNMEQYGRRRNMLYGIVHDIYLLSKADFVVCTFTSNVGKVVYELMHANGKNTVTMIRNLDGDYGLVRMCSVKFIYKSVRDFKSTSSTYLNMSVGDVIQRRFFTGNPDISIVGTNLNNRQQGYFKLENVKRLWPLYRLPTFSHLSGD